MKKPAAAKVMPGMKVKAKQPGNRPGRGKSAKTKPAHVSAQVKAQRHKAAVAAAKTRAKNAKKAKQHKRVQLALGEAVACCAAEALAASLRLTGRPVSDADVLALYWRTASDPDAGASILATLEAAAEYGLAGVRPVFAEGCFADGNRPYGLFERQCWIGTHGCLQAVQDRRTVPDDGGLAAAHALILGLALPAPHAVLHTPDGWWSWGEIYSPAEFPDAVIEDAWEVTWPAIR